MRKDKTQKLKIFFAMIVFKCIIDVTKLEKLILVELETASDLLHPMPTIVSSKYKQYLCERAKIRKIFDCTTQSCGKSSETGTPRSSFDQKALPQWIIVQTKKRVYKVGKIMQTVHVCTNSSAAIERKWTPAITGPRSTGSYIRRTCDGQILVHGEYKCGFRDGPWIYYDEFGNVTHKILYNWQVEIALKQAAKENDMQTMIQIIHDNWEKCFGNIPGMADRLENFLMNKHIVVQN